MRTLTRRTKKLTIAFWLHSSGEPGWKCADCRVLGEEEHRRCGHFGYTSGSEDSPVWSKGTLVLTACPKPLVSGASLAFLSAYALWLGSGKPGLMDADARCVDAILHLNQLAANANRSVQREGHLRRGQAADQDL